MPLAYAFAYLARRVSAVAGVVDYCFPNGAPRRVLDVGSGTDTTRIALQLLYPRVPFSVTTLEPSRAMRSFAESLISTAGRIEGDRGSITPRRLGITIEDAYQGRIPKSCTGADLVVASACLPYRYRDVASFVDLLLNLCAPGGHVIVIEPRSKKDLVDWVAAELRSKMRIDVAVHSSTNVASEFRSCGALVQTTRLYRSVIGDLCPLLADYHAAHQLARLIAHSGVLSAIPDGDVFVAMRRPGLFQEFTSSSDI